MVLTFELYTLGSCDAFYTCWSRLRFSSYSLCNLLWLGSNDMRFYSYEFWFSSWTDSSIEIGICKIFSVSSSWTKWSSVNFSGSSGQIPAALNPDTPFSSGDFRYALLKIEAKSYWVIFSCTWIRKYKITFLTQSIL